VGQHLKLAKNLQRFFCHKKLQRLKNDFVWRSFGRAWAAEGGLGGPTDGASGWTAITVVVNMSNA
jgi:hypothetical protein